MNALKMPPVTNSTEACSTGLNNYQFLRLLGSGGEARVYLAEHIRSHTQVAIKIPRIKDSPDAQDKFLREARILNSLKHPHIVPIHESGMDNGMPFLVMGYAPYGHIRQYHALQKPLQISTILCYLEQVAKALQSLHNDGLIHQDIKSENLLLVQPGHIWLCDFSIAVPVGTLRNGTPGVSAGTIPYMAPEQLRGAPCIASDQYSLAIVVYEWLCGETPFQGSLWSIMQQHISAAPPLLSKSLPALSPQVDAVMQKALAKDPHQRFSSASAFASTLESALMRSVGTNFTKKLLLSPQSLTTEQATHFVY